ncbi:Chromosome partition protein Smc [Candidatus Tiddalikarchaeum anstoanum]|nr:Chromosome partition protein Smc [Candidatus Tiddalikarchaeum anstoanum]
MAEVSKEDLVENEKNNRVIVEEAKKAFDKGDYDIAKSKFKESSEICKEMAAYEAKGELQGVGKDWQNGIKYAEDMISKIEAEEKTEGEEEEIEGKIKNMESEPESEETEEEVDKDEAEVKNTVEELDTELEGFIPAIKDVYDKGPDELDKFRDYIINSKVGTISESVNKKFEILKQELDNLQKSFEKENDDFNKDKTELEELSNLIKRHDDKIKTLGTAKDEDTKELNEEKSKLKDKEDKFKKRSDDLAASKKNLAEKQRTFDAFDSALAVDFKQFKDALPKEDLDYYNYLFFLLAEKLTFPQRTHTFLMGAENEAMNAKKQELSKFGQAINAISNIFSNNVELLCNDTLKPNDLISKLGLTNFIETKVKGRKLIENLFLNEAGEFDKAKFDTLHNDLLNIAQRVEKANKSPVYARLMHFYQNLMVLYDEILVENIQNTEIHEYIEQKLGEQGDETSIFGLYYKYAEYYNYTQKIIDFVKEEGKWFSETFKEFQKNFKVFNNLIPNFDLIADYMMGIIQLKKGWKKDFNELASELDKSIKESEKEGLKINYEKAGLDFSETPETETQIIRDTIGKQTKNPNWTFFSKDDLEILNRLYTNLNDFEENLTKLIEEISSFDEDETEDIEKDAFEDLLGTFNLTFKPFSAVYADFKVLMNILPKNITAFNEFIDIFILYYGDNNKISSLILDNTNNNIINSLKLTKTNTDNKIIDELKNDIDAMISVKEFDKLW